VSITIGRVTIVEALSFIEQDGDRLDIDVTISNRTTAGSVVAGKMIRHQLLGLVGNEDEEVVPVTSDDDPELDGYYQVVSVTIDPLEVFLASGAMMCSFQLERVANGWALPVLELVSTAAVRTNAVGVADAEPDAVIGWRFQTLPFYDLDNGLTQIERFSDGPDNVRVYLETAPWSATSQKVFITPSAFYGSGCLIEIQGTDNAWYPVIGRQAPPGMAGKWRISNGLVRFTASATNVGDLKVEVFDNDVGAWRSMTSELRYGIHTGGAFSDNGSSAVSGFARATDGTNAQWAEPYIIRNDRDTVIIGFRRARGAVQTFTLHAGDYFVEFFSHLSSSVFLQAIQARTAWTSAALSATAPFSATPGIEESSNDANGNRLVLLYTDAAHTRYTVSPSGLYQTAGSADAAFGIGVVYAGSGAAAGNAALDIAEQWCVAKSWRTFTVAQ
jgi:hypothetical protein